MAMMIITLSLDCKHCSARPGWNDIKCFATSPGLIRLPPSSKVAGLEEWCKRGNSNAGTSSVMGRIRALPWPPVSHASGPGSVQTLLLWRGLTGERPESAQTLAVWTGWRSSGWVMRERPPGRDGWRDSGSQNQGWQDVRGSTISGLLSTIKGLRPLPMKIHLQFMWNDA